MCKWRFVGGAYSGSRDPSAMARARVTMRQLGVVTCMAPAFANATRCEERAAVQRARFVGAGAYSGARDPRQHGARARAARAVAARASDLRTPMVQHCQN